MSRVLYLIRHGRSVRRRRRGRRRLRRGPDGSHIGGWEGLPFEEIVASDADLVHRIRNQRTIWSYAPSGVSERDFRTRIVTALGSILRTTPTGTSSPSRTAG